MHHGEEISWNGPYLYLSKTDHKQNNLQTLHWNQQWQAKCFVQIIFTPWFCMYSICFKLTLVVSYGSINSKPAHPSPEHLSDICLLISKLSQIPDDGASLRIQMPPTVGKAKWKNAQQMPPPGGGDERAWNWSRHYVFGILCLLELSTCHPGQPLKPVLKCE